LVTVLPNDVWIGNQPNGTGADHCGQVVIRCRARRG
jgi:hypothetical protein